MSVMPPPSPADLARQRHNQKRDDKRKAGTLALRTVQQQAPVAAGGGLQTPSKPPPPPNPQAQPAPLAAAPSAQPIPPIQKPPELQPPAAPLPHENTATFTPTQYQPPKKGLEYLALGLGVLFPGAPIAKAAAGFAQGLNQGAQQNYDRREQQDQQQYASQKENIQVDLANQQQNYKAAQDAAQIKFTNDQARYQQQNELRAQGIGPDGKPLPFPPVESLLPKGQPPSNDGYAQAYRQLATRAQQMGATTIAQNFATQAEDYNKRALDDANNVRALEIASYTQNHQDARENLRLSTEVGLAQTRERNENAREEYRVAHEDARAIRGDANRLAGLQDEATRSSISFRQNWIKALKPVLAHDADGHPIYQKDAQGNPVFDSTGKPQPVMMPTLSAASAKALPTIFPKIDRDPNPQARAEWYAEQIPDQTAKELLLERGRASTLNLRSQGYAIPNLTYALPKTAPKIDPLKAAGLDLAQPKVKALVDHARSIGLDPTDPQVLSEIKKSLANPAPVTPSPVPEEQPDLIPAI